VFTSCSTWLQHSNSRKSSDFANKANYNYSRNDLDNYNSKTYYCTHNTFCHNTAYNYTGNNTIDEYIWNDYDRKERI
jgi:hypothetical protein